MVNCSATDVLAGLSTKDVNLWYYRLAKAIGKKKLGGEEPMASRFLEWYVSPQSRTGPEVFRAPKYVVGHTIVKDALKYHRRVYLTREKARLGKTTKWAGIKPRWQNPASYGWDGKSPLSMHYQALVQVPILWQITGNDEELDILYGLGLGFQLRTDVVATVKPQGSDLAVEFTQFDAKIVDRYDFNPSEHITVPNPDYGSTGAGAVCPQKEKLVVYHTNAIRMEKAHYAAPYDLESTTWAVTDTSISGPGTVTL